MPLTRLKPLCCAWLIVGLSPTALAKPVDSKTKGVMKATIHRALDRWLGSEKWRVFEIKARPGRDRYSFGANFIEWNRFGRPGIARGMLVTGDFSWKDRHLQFKSNSVLVTNLGRRPEKIGGRVRTVPPDYSGW